VSNFRLDSCILVDDEKGISSGRVYNNHCLDSKYDNVML